MTDAVYVNLTAAYRKVLADLDEAPIVSPRGLLTKELPGYSFRLTNSRDNLIASPTRKLSQAYAIAEWLWIMFGRNDVATIVPFNKKLIDFSDDGIRFMGAYGPQLLEQWSYVATTLFKDPFSRQAIIEIWRQRPGSSKDIPCTLSFQFLVRDGKLNMITTMRSNDAWLGLPYDVFTFTQIQAVMALQLGLPPGWYHHQVGSMHIYEPHWELAKQARQELAWQMFSGKYPLPSADLVPMPLCVEPAFIGLTLGTQHKVAWRELLKSVEVSIQYVPQQQVWLNYLKVLAHKLEPSFELPAQYQALHDLREHTSLILRQDEAPK